MTSITACCACWNGAATTCFTYPVTPKDVGIETGIHRRTNTIIQSQYRNNGDERFRSFVIAATASTKTATCQLIDHNETAIVLSAVSENKLIWLCF